MFNRSIPTVDIQEAHRRLTAEADDGQLPLLVDVRELEEYVAVRADGARLIPLSQFTVRYEELPRDRPLLMICQGGGRSAQATAFLLAAGWPDVSNVAGGTGSWLAAGLPVRSGPPTDEELARSEAS